MKYKVVILLILMLLVATCHPSGNHDERQAQTTHANDTLWTPTGNTELDSLLHLAASAKPDTNLAILYEKIGDMYQNNDYEKAKEYYLRLKNLSEQLDWNRGRYGYAVEFANILNRELLADTALVILQQALDLARREKDESWEANFLANIGTAYSVKEWHETALSYYMEALSFYEKRNDSRRLQQVYYMMSQIYTDIKDFDKAIEYSEKSVAINSEFVYSLYTLGLAYSKVYQHEKAKKYYEEALRISESQNNIYTMGMLYYRLTDDAIMDFDLDIAEQYAQQSLEINKQFGHTYCCNNYIAISKIELLKGNYGASEAYAKEALEIAIEYDMLASKQYCYKILSQLAIAQRKFRESIKYSVEIDLIENEIAKSTTRRNAEEMSAKYETEKKEIKITALEERQRFILLLFISAGVVFLLALAALFFLWRWTVQKRQHAEIRILQLEQEKQLIATQSVLDGETQERTRLARDLHDGLGSLLSTLRLNLEDVFKCAVLAPNVTERFRKAFGLLDESTREMRRVAHHLMPDALSRFGLRTALADFCNAIPTAEFVYFGDEQRFDRKLEEVIYRIAHELINNSLKHADASHILVQIVQEAHRIALTVEDDGRGFDPNMATEGMGIQNIRTRVTSFGGTIDIQSDAKEGTAINVEFQM